MTSSPPSPERSSLGKRNADEITTNEVEEVVADAQEEPEFKKVKVDHISPAHKLWEIGMEIPQGKRRPHLGKLTHDSESGSGSIEDPKIIWLGKVPHDSKTKKANEDIARRASSRLETITHVYIVCGTQSSKFVDRDGKRIHLWYPDGIHFQHKTTAADPHMFLAFGTKPDHVVLYGYINVTVDETGKPTDFATSRNEDFVVDGDDRIFELFPYEYEEHDCSPYCPRHKSGEESIDVCEDAQPRSCRLHNTDNLIDHFCRRTRWRTEILGDHYCPCYHDKDGLLDHYCPCPHDIKRLRDDVWHHCPHKIPAKAKHTHYCPSYPF
ncbi:uncharacterized protein GGS22DRAFT_199129 [Annulohypoxylon maeteangense]|uniref:uncharacterized protein n=1 Tax=Annulohypoxylon maeteangense TaxID=1927788 RepID=UPI002007243A|nr:uncharacterized protein GGS22DRAFT_199129 [Annulohypoxylon maeteangense]KAI0886772.1 hypothetical protein GGS22DRAFT_199129 [Annulohypoxylon maeteangense]